MGKTFIAPFDECVGDEIYNPTKDKNNLTYGFGIANRTCDARTGEISTQVFQFGGIEGQVGEPPNYEATVLSGVIVTYVPLYSGELSVDVSMRVNAKVVVAAGATGIIPDIEDAMLAQVGQSAVDAISRVLLGIADVAQALLTPSGAIVEGDIYLNVDSGIERKENKQSITGKNYGASFPLPDYSQEEVIQNRSVVTSIVIPVEAGQPVRIETGLKTHGFVHGWAWAAWNAKNDQVSYVDSIQVTELDVPINKASIPEFEGTIFDERGKRFFKMGGEWLSSSTGYDEHHWLVRTDSVDTSGRWLLNPASSGQWEVFVYIPATATSSQANYFIYHDGLTETKVVDQEGNNNKWVSLGIYNFAGQGEEYLELRTNTVEMEAPNLLAYDAVGIRWVGDSQSVLPTCIANNFTISSAILVFILVKRRRIT